MSEKSEMCKISAILGSPSHFNSRAVLLYVNLFGASPTEVNEKTFWASDFDRTPAFLRDDSIWMSEL